METPDDGQDMIGHGDDRPDRPMLFGWASPRVTVLAVAALAVGLIAGYLGGHQQARPPVPSGSVRTTSPRPSPPATAPSFPSLVPALTATGNRCALERGKTLTLGVEVANQSTQPINVGQFRALLPLGGLRATAASVGTCGALYTGAPFSPALAAGATEWLTITFDVLVRCPQPLPVQFAVSYTRSGKAATAQFDEFPDLGDVTYAGCQTAQ
jgi:hypothetical protein